VKRIFKLEVPEFEAIITARPAGMSFKDYRIKRKEQQEKLKFRKTGFLVYLASEIITQQIGWQKIERIVKYPPFVGRVKNLKIV
jgi:hypothetical protein